MGILWDLVGFFMGNLARIMVVFYGYMNGDINGNIHRIWMGYLTLIRPITNDTEKHGWSTTTSRRDVTALESWLVSWLITIIQPKLCWKSPWTTTWYCYFNIWTLQSGHKHQYIHFESSLAVPKTPTCPMWACPDMRSWLPSQNLSSHVLAPYIAGNIIWGFP